MQSIEVSELHYLFPPNTNQFPVDFGLTSNDTSTYQFHRFSNPLHQLHITTPHPQSTCFSSTYSTSDEGDEQQLSIINERKQRRMLSNRESARRSRMRKQKHLDELWSQVVWLRNENHQLLEKLNHASERHDQVIQENAQLKDEALELRQMLTDMRLNSPFPTLRELQDDPCNDFP
ncbi:hypothetical protein BUALT_Bualt16G0025500 [Buddleja alternifolia]|uniref:BZIP domain-containing protein n=1 Tax=Buddleja alternifolia TaxID=168488 RepID=A0AAV6W663_9LAMI|nr:hypothetical protein BUALT_Bualt16G0025500 [Buddleja alternifolia]